MLAKASILLLTNWVRTLIVHATLKNVTDMSVSIDATNPFAVYASLGRARSGTFEEFFHA